MEMSNRILTESFIGRVSVYSWFPNSVRVSPDNKHIAWIETHRPPGSPGIDKFIVLVDGKARNGYYGTVGENSIIFSSDSKRLAYAAAGAHMGVVKWFLVVDGKEEKKQYDGVTAPVFSPDSKHFAYQAYKSSVNRFVVFDGNELKPRELVNCCQDIGWGPLFTPDSKHIIYVAKDNNGRKFVVQDEKVISSESYFDIVYLTVSPSGEAVYVAKPEADQKEVLVIGGKKIQVNYDIISVPTFSPNGNHLAYVINKEDKKYVIVDNKESKAYDRILPGLYSLYFSPDSRYLGYVALVNNELWWMVNKLE